MFYDRTSTVPNILSMIVGGLITLETHVHAICNLPGICCIMRSKMWQCANFQFLSVNGPILGHFWAPKCAGGPK